jgi:hypothetical protein
MLWVARRNMEKVQEELNLVKALGRAFEFVKAICDKIVSLGGNDNAAWLIVKEPAYAQQFAEVLLGKSKIVPEDSLKVVQETGRTLQVRIMAAKELKSDEDRMKVLDNPERIVFAALSGLEDRRKLYEWFVGLSPGQIDDSKNRHQFPWLLIFQHMYDIDLLQIALHNVKFAFKAVQAIKDQGILKVVIENSEIGIAVCQAVEQLDDYDYILKLSEAQAQKDPHGTTNFTRSINKRMELIRSK